MNVGFRAKEMELSSKIDLKDVSWWMCIKDARRLGAMVTIKLSKEGYIYLAARGRSSHTAHEHD